MSPSPPAVIPGSTKVRPEPAFSTPWLRVAQADWVWQGETSTWWYLDHPGTVVVVPVDRDGRAAMEWVWRPPLQQWSLELPAGRIEPGEAPEVTARREVAEEVGGLCERLVPLGSAYASSGSSNERAHLFAASVTAFVGQAPDRDELIESVYLSREAAVGALYDGTVRDALCALALYRAVAAGVL